MGFETWDEIRTAWQVARLGTVSGAAEVLGVHHATVIRHIDALEGRLGVRLFQRHARGYTPTDAGRELLEVAQGASDRFDQLAARIKGQSERVTGELIVTAISGIPDLLAPVITSFQQAHPGLIVRFLTDMRLFRLSSGEAHVAIRAGAKPEDPDYVVQKFVHVNVALFAARSYAGTHGTPASEAELAAHHFVGPDDPASRAPYYVWLRQAVPAAAVTFRTSEPAAAEAAVRAGAGLGFLRVCEVGSDPDLIQVLPPRPEWASPLWLVTHVDLHRTLKIQSFLAHLKRAAEGWTDI
jgi:DNA-binding transcriptional LysR family regulator